eukprot:CAMPEP_0115019220 /NCGR_PEP_ID=MMETSP0216-20121206/29305_1 /TAXON_ID=223996 /ORGANISM="Protocruzia adherens, Strain Boccale" /LENGTH=434 /DNA_ID=CAMNT_0002390631 /DNA_START=1 /DNA_END=1305 /DNA_ORIENTATION=+
MYRGKEVVLCVLKNTDAGLKALTRGAANVPKVNESCLLFHSKVDYAVDPNFTYRAAGDILKISTNGQWVDDFWSRDLKRVLDSFFIAAFPYYDTKTEKIIYFVNLRSMEPSMFNTEMVEQLCHNETTTWQPLSIFFEDLASLGVETARDGTLQAYVDKYWQKYNVETIFESDNDKFVLRDRVENRLPDYMLVLCEDHPDWSTHRDILISALFMGDADTYIKIIDAPKLVEPTEEELLHAKGIILTGGHYSAYEDLEWLKALQKNLKKWTDTYDNLKILGFCLGSQIMALAHGGDVKKLETPFVFGTETFNVQQNFASKDYVRDSVYQLGEANELTLLESHGDHVSRLPDNATLYASSAGAYNELWGIGDNVLCFQAHPEVNRDMWDSVLKDRLVMRKIIDQEMKEKAETNFRNHPVDYIGLRDICARFLGIVKD